MKEKINIDETIKKATKEAIKEFDKEKREEQKKKVFHNTRLLLKHYNDLKSHVQNAIDDVNKLEEGLEELGDLSSDELYILSIKRSKAKTLIMIAHVDMAMALLQQKQTRLCSLEKYQALEYFYLDELTYEQIAERLNCNERTTRRWINEMLNELGVLLFGIDGLKMDAV
ncbi:helix-turn-helix domain-containing protein [Clostridium thermarum]|uniref:helix-turn-helix domain-containing protein n=1 Tax=Clostridium thermarum TaxID=1716543 RepID=UPI00112044DB|nr:helix-turn-helix domain-containing protein [Clostridium thermarum]